VSKLAAGWRIQSRVISALMMRELVTRFGRENIGFLWMMAEPLLFAVLVGVMWRYLHGPEEHGVSVVAFIASGYIPLTLFRQSMIRATKVFSVNAGLLYHRQIKILDFIFVRFLIEAIGAMMAFTFIGLVLIAINEAPVPADVGSLLAGWFLYCLLTFSLCLVLAPLFERRRRHLGHPGDVADHRREQHRLRVGGVLVRGRVGYAGVQHGDEPGADRAEHGRSHLPGAGGAGR